jgi:hypothetical protein
LIALEVVLLVGGAASVAVSDPNFAQCQSTAVQLGEGVSSSLTQTCQNYEIAHALGLVALGAGGAVLAVICVVTLMLGWARR